ncbi:MAG: glycosyltransferase [Candidatus Delongbacteria bacterium]|nr:glycosyltransferase [Candidatus Delongbacteria bacterium]MDD4205160.1 glycosyltransferase [Candidatus Delongbacteria bacterium]
MTENDPKILILTHCFPLDPSDIPGNFIYDLCIVLKQLGVKVTLLTQKMEGERDSDFLERSGAEIVYFDWKGGSERFSDIKLGSFKNISSVLSLILKGRKKFRELMKDNDFDLILNCWIVPSGTWSYGSKAKSKTAVWALGSDVSVYSKKTLFKFILKKILTRSDMVFTNSLHNSGEIKKIFNAKSSILYTGRKLPPSSVVYKAEQKLKLAFVGRLEKIKGPDLLISALILSKISDFELKVVGDGSMRAELESAVESNGLSGKVIFLGMKNASEISDVLSGSDYLVISSRSESMPVVFWEAMQTLTPVISTDAGDIKHYCEQFNVGRVCGPDEKSLSDLLTFVNDFRPLRPILSENTKKAAGTGNIQNSAEILKNLCKNIDKVQ